MKKLRVKKDGTESAQGGEYRVLVYVPRFGCPRVGCKGRLLLTRTGKLLCSSHHKDCLQAIKGLSRHLRADILQLLRMAKKIEGIH